VSFRTGTIQRMPRSGSGHSGVRDLSRGPGSVKCSRWPQWVNSSTRRPRGGAASIRRTTIKGPGLRIRFDVRRQWLCPQCGRTLKLAGHIVAQACRCTEPPTWMTLVPDPKPERPTFERIVVPEDAPVAEESRPAAGRNGSPNAGGTANGQERRGGRRKSRGKQDGNRKPVGAVSAAVTNSSEAGTESSGEKDSRHAAPASPPDRPATAETANRAAEVANDNGHRASPADPPAAAPASE